ncbi:MAG: dTMP kinase [Ruminococcus sp.]|nr:dTMP kinase [Ruminococcus sp.]
MKKNDYRGVFIAFDGPNGAGKTTLIRLVEMRLKELGFDILVTNEPTSTCLGEYVRDFSETHRGIGLACLVMCDRYEHLNNEIVPALQKGQIVITDRYVLSSLIFQGIDGVDTGFIMSICSEMTKPDLQIAVYANAEILRERLSDRVNLTRFEKENQSKNELFFMRKGIDLFRKEEIIVKEIDNNEHVEHNVEMIISSIEKIRREKM